MEQIAVALITVCIPTLATIWTSHEDRKFAKQSDARQVILQMILEDKFYWYTEHKLPLNCQLIHEQWNKYHEAHGNHEVDIKFEEYKKWYSEIENQLRKELEEHGLQTN